MFFYADDADPDMDYKWEHTFGPLTMIPDYPADKVVSQATKAGVIPDNPGDMSRMRIAMPCQTKSMLIGLLAFFSSNTQKSLLFFLRASAGHILRYTRLKNTFDRFPLKDIEIPRGLRLGDLKDCAPSLANTSLYAFRRYQMLLKHKSA